MKRVIMFLASVVVMVAFSACGRDIIDKSISHIEKTVDKIEKEKDNMSREELEELAIEMEAPLAVLESALTFNEMSMKQALEATAALARWGVVSVQVGINNFAKENNINLEDLGDEVVNSASEGLKALEKATGLRAKEIKEEVGSSIEDFSKELEDSGKEIEDALKELQKSLE